MTILLKTPTIAPRVAALLATMLSSLGAVAADHPLPRVIAASLVATAQPDDSEKLPSELFDLDFKGGSLAEYITALRAVAPRANIVVEGGSSDVVLPPIRLRQVDLRSAMQLLAQQDGAKSTIRLSDVQPTGLATGELSAPVYVVAVRPGAAARQNAMYVESLRSAIELGGITAAQALEAVEVAVRSTGLAEQTSIAFHEPTRLLMVSGPPVATDSVKQVIAALVAKPLTEARSAHYEQMKSQLEGQRDQANSRLASAQSAAERLREELERREPRMADLESQLLDRAASLRMAQVELEMVKKQLEEQEPLKRQLNECNRHRSELMQQVQTLTSQLKGKAEVPARGGS